MSHGTTRLTPDLLDVPIPFPSRLSPDVARARTRHLAWVDRLGLWPDPAVEGAYRAADFPLFVARTHPWAVGADLDLATDLIGWSWLWDDSLDKPGPRQASPGQTAASLGCYRAALAGRQATDAEPPLVRAWRCLLDRLTSRTSPHWRARHRSHWEATFASYLQEAENNARGFTPAFADYLRMRRNAGGMDICLDWVEAVGRYELPPRLHASPLVLALRRDEQDVVAMTNDLFSARNEWAAGNTDNVVHVLAEQHQCSWAEAARGARTLIAEAVARFQRGERELYQSQDFHTLSTADRRNTRRFVEAMKAWMRGSRDWHLTCPRYR